MKRALPWLLAAIVLAGLAYETTLIATPRILMAVVMRRLTMLGGINQMVYPPRADATQRKVVMPSPDLLYSVCVYDLSHGALRVHAEIPAGSYWSLSAYDARTDNFFSVNDRQLKGTVADLLLVAPDAAPLTAPPGTQLLRSPSRRGLLLLRMLIDRDEDLPQLDALRRQASCQLQPS